MASFFWKTVQKTKKIIQETRMEPKSDLEPQCLWRDTADSRWQQRVTAFSLLQFNPILNTREQAEKTRKQPELSELTDHREPKLN